MKYATILKNEGIADSRTKNLTEAIDNLHYALCQLDSKNLKLFLKKDILNRVNDYAKTEEIKIIEG